MLEYGLVHANKGKQIINEIFKAVQSLMKLEEGWIEKQLETKKFSVKIKIYNVIGIFAKCREHIAMILIELLVLIKDHNFMESYPTYVKDDTDQQTMREELAETFVFFDKEINDQILFITMNYLANPI